jgi:phage minor structural protein
MYVTNKVRSINIKNSNYFNAIQTICETFEVWADFVVDHSEEGKIISKKVIFKESIEKPNYVGFRYGTNLKSSKRTIDSKTFVSKLIVPDNSNEFAKNGFCSISRAGANTSGENYIYDFSYYYNFGMLD